MSIGMCLCVCARVHVETNEQCRVILQVPSAFFWDKVSLGPGPHQLFKQSLRSLCVRHASLVPGLQIHTTMPGFCDITSDA